MLRSLEQPISPFTRQEIERESSYRIDDMQLSPEIVGHLDAARRFLSREPERRWRVLRVLCANWLADVEFPVPGRAGPTGRAWLSGGKNSVTMPLYPVSPDAPAGARLRRILRLRMDLRPRASFDSEIDRGTAGTIRVVNMKNGTRFANASLR
jgi:hypothetical protein